MPIENGVGFSEYTAEKHRCVEKVIKWHMSVVAHIQNKHCWARQLGPYVYIDTTSGPGVFEATDTAPLCVCRLARQLKMECKSFLYEENDDTFLELIQSTNGRSECALFHADFMDHMTCNAKIFPSKRFGLLYYDPTGYRDFGRHMDFFGWYLKRPRFVRTDILMNINANAIKKMHGANLTEGLLDHLAKVPRKYALIRKPVARDKWQFSLMFYTDWAAVRDWKREGFYRLDSEEGLEVLSELCLTKKERKAGRHIERTASTFAIRDTAKSEPRPCVDQPASVNGAATKRQQKFIT